MKISKLLLKKASQGSRRAAQFFFRMTDLVILLLSFIFKGISFIYFCVVNCLK